jgi:hypothetical protein
MKQNTAAIDLLLAARANTDAVNAEGKKASDYIADSA